METVSRPDGATQPREGLTVVVIGSSAGGLEALRGLLPHLPVNNSFTYLIAQHLAPQHKSMLTELLARETELETVEIADGMPILSGRLHVTPPNADAILSRGKLQLRPCSDRGPRPSVDVLMTSVAEEVGGAAIGIVLSGTGSDGARGAHAIRAAGGMVFAQDPGTAKYAGMPKAVIDAGVVDAVLSPEQIGRRLEALSSSGGDDAVKAAGATGRADLDQILEKINLATRVDFRGYKTKTISRRITQRMAAVQAGNLAQYQALLDNQPDEVARLCRNCLISVTSFFRDPEAFADLGAELRRVFGGSERTQPLRVWVPACATGEEAYTIAMVFREALPNQRVQIFGTDVDAESVQRARKALYLESQLQGLTSEQVSTYFRRLSNGFHVERSLRESVVFARHDLLRDPLFLNLDLVSCRNLLIYLKPSVKDDVIRKFHHALKPGGLLMLGKSEHANESHFDVVGRRNKLYRNKEPVPGERRVAPTRDWTSGWDGPASSGDNSAAGSPQSDVLRQAILANFAPAAVLVDSSFQILDTSGQAGRFLSFRDGKPDLTLMGLAPRSLTATLRAQLHRASRTMTPSASLPKQVPLPTGTVTVRTVVHPLLRSSTNDKLFAVVFEEIPTRPRRSRTSAADAITMQDEHLRELEHELSATRENLQSAVEELETANEELQSLNEELQSSNEELQASNEELQASNEELQSNNEELLTVNEELEHKSTELGHMLEDLENVQNGLDAPVLVLDARGHLKRLNRGATKLLGLTLDDLNSPIAIPGETALVSALAARVQKVLREGTNSEFRTRVGRRQFLVRVRAYVGGREHVHGVVVVFHEVTELAKATDKLRKSDAHLRTITIRQETILKAMSVHVAVLDQKGNIIEVNDSWRRFAEANGYGSTGHGTGLNYIGICESATGSCSEGALEMAEGVRKVLQHELPEFSREYPCHSPRQERWFRCIVKPLSADAGGAIVAHTDITDLYRLREEIRRQSAALHSAASAIFIADTDARIDWVNEAFLRQTGYSRDELIGQTPEMLTGHGSREPQLIDIIRGCRDSGGAVWTGEVRLVSMLGSEYTVRQTVTPIPGAEGSLTHFVVVHEDITGHKQVQERMVYMAEHDDLTGLWNRKSFNELLRAAVTRHAAQGTQLALLFLDLDRFKDTNDTLGHLVGDLMLVEIARRLRANLREHDALARFGGDEFVILLEDAADREQAGFIVERILHSFSRPIDIDGRSMFVTASIGITMFPEDGATSEELLRNADLAMYRAKSEGRRGYCFWDRRLESDMTERVNIERELSRAIGTRDLWIAYQPQWEVRSGNVVGVESLLRWNNASATSIPIGRVVSIAEESGSILPIGQWVIRESVAQVQHWKSNGYPLRVSVNLSAVQFHQQDVFAIITEAIRNRGLGSDCLKAEITESVLLNRSTRVRETLHALHGAGIGLVLDDFGTGYSSLTYLQQFPIESVKIDSSFLRGIGKNRNDEAIVTGIIKMAHSLGQSVVAEGVETAEQLDFLRSTECDFAQGFLVAPALEAQEFERFYKKAQVNSTSA